LNHESWHHPKFLKCVAQTASQSNRWSWSTTGTLDAWPIDANPSRPRPPLRSPSNPVPRTESSDPSMPDSKLPIWSPHLLDSPQSPLLITRYAIWIRHCYISAPTHLTGLPVPRGINILTQVTFHPQNSLFRVAARHIFLGVGTSLSIQFLNLQEGEDALLCNSRVHMYYDTTLSNHDCIWKPVVQSLSQMASRASADAVWPLKEITYPPSFREESQGSVVIRGFLVVLPTLSMADCLPTAEWPMFPACYMQYPHSAWRR
jgi:hypothetical protein